MKIKQSTLFINKNIVPLEFSVKIPSHFSSKGIYKGEADISLTLDTELYLKLKADLGEDSKMKVRIFEGDSEIVGWIKVKGWVATKRVKKHNHYEVVFKNIKVKLKKVKLR